MHTAPPSPGQPVRAYVGLGSNSPDAADMLTRARQGLAAFSDMRAGAASPVYRTEPQGYADQPWFHNQVVELLPGPSWRPCALVAALLALEARLGRVRPADPGLRFGPRRIDADLLLFGDMRSGDPRCLLPHPRLTRRAFALVPLRDVAPMARIDGLTPDMWLARLRWRMEGDRIFQ